MSERIPSQASDPKLPPRKSVEEILQLEPEAFEVAAKDAGFKSADAFREMLSKAATTSAKWKEQQSLVKPVAEPILEENAQRIRKAVELGLKRLYFDDVERDLAKADRLKEEADELIRTTNKKIENKERTEGQLYATYVRAANLYTEAYQIQAMNEFDALVAGGEDRSRALQHIAEQYADKAKKVNLAEERRAIRRVVDGLIFQTSIRAEETRPLYAAMQAPAPLSYDNRLQLQKIIAEAKGVVFSGRRSFARHGVIDAVAQALREQEIWKKEVDGTSGSAEYFSTGTMNAYSPHSRPRRDMYGQFGGQDDK